MFLDRCDTLDLAFVGAHEPAVTALLRREVKPGDVAVDIGAHIGYFTLLLSRLVGEKGKVFAFEPDPDNFALLRRNAELNGLRNVVLESKAVSDAGGRIRLYRAEGNSGDHRIFDDSGRREAVEVDSVRLDDYFAGSGVRVDFIKMDIQGAEPGAVRGMEALLRRSAGFRMVAEFWPYGLRRCGVKPSAYLDQLRTQAFKLHRIDGKQGNIETLDPDWLPGTEEFEFVENLYCVKT